MNEKVKKIVLCALSTSLIISAFSGCEKKKEEAGKNEEAEIEIEAKKEEKVEENEEEIKVEETEKIEETEAVEVEDDVPILSISTVSEEIDKEKYDSEIAKYEEFEVFYESLGKKITIKPHGFSFDAKSYAAEALYNQLPTYYNVPMTEAKFVIAAGYAKDITPWIEKYGYLDGLEPTIKRNITADKNGDGVDEVYLMPTSMYSTGIAVNMKLLNRAGYVEEDGTPHQPATFEELAEMAADIKEKTGVAGFSIPIKGNAGGWRFMPVAWAYGVDFMEQDANGKWKATFNTPECIEALEWIYDLKWEYDCLPENLLIDNATERNEFGAGKTAMCFAEGSSANAFLKAGMRKEELGFIQMPAGTKRHVTLVGGSYNVFNANATDEEIDAAFEYLEWTKQSRKFDDAVKQEMYDALLEKAINEEYVGVLNASPYSDTEAKRAYEIELNTKTPEEGGLRTAPYNQVKLYNDQSKVEWQQEEPIEAQALYQILESVIQNCLTFENADIPSLLAEAEKEFQRILDDSIINNN